MLYWLYELTGGEGPMNLFRYISFRAGGAFFTALIFAFLFGRPLIEYLRRVQKKGQPIRDDGPEGHFVKAGTPTMGGILILSALLVGTLLWARLSNGYVWIVLMVTYGYGAIGFADDYAKVSKHNTKGVSGKVRMALGFTLAFIAAAWTMYLHPESLTGKLAFPFFKDLFLHLGSVALESERIHNTVRHELVAVRPQFEHRKPCFDGHSAELRMPEQLFSNRDIRPRISRQINLLPCM